MMMIIGKPILQEESNTRFMKILVSYLSSLVYFSLDIFFVSFITKVFPLKRRSQFYVFIFLSLILYMLNQSLLLFAKGVSFTLCIEFLFLFWITNWKSDNLMYPIFILLGVICPSYAIFGRDLIWGDSFSLMRFSQPLEFYFFAIIFALSGFYLYYKDGKINNWRKNEHS